MISTKCQKTEMNHLQHASSTDIVLVFVEFLWISGAYQPFVRMVRVIVLFVVLFWSIGRNRVFKLIRIAGTGYLLLYQ